MGFTCLLLYISFGVPMMVSILIPLLLSIYMSDVRPHVPPLAQLSVCTSSSSFSTTHDFPDGSIHPAPDITGPNENIPPNIASSSSVTPPFHYQSKSPECASTRLSSQQKASSQLWRTSVSRIPSGPTGRSRRSSSICIRDRHASRPSNRSDIQYKSVSQSAGFNTTPSETQLSGPQRYKERRRSQSCAAPDSTADGRLYLRDHHPIQVRRPSFEPVTDFPLRFHSGKQKTYSMTRSYSDHVMGLRDVQVAIRKGFYVLGIMRPLFDRLRQDVCWALFRRKLVLLLCFLGNAPNSHDWNPSKTSSVALQSNQLPRFRNGIVSSSNQVLSNGAQGDLTQMNLKSITLDPKVYGKEQIRRDGSRIILMSVGLPIFHSLLQNHLLLCEVCDDSAWRYQKVIITSWLLFWWG